MEPNKAWPVARVVKSLADYAGTYEARSRDPVQNTPPNYREWSGLRQKELSYELAGWVPPLSSVAVRVEILPRTSGSGLIVRSLDKNGRELSVKNLEKGKDFDFSQGHLHRYSRSSENSKYGLFRERTRLNFYLASDGGLLLANRVARAALVWYFIPQLSLDTIPEAYWRRVSPGSELPEKRRVHP